MSYSVGVGNIIIKISILVTGFFTILIVLYNNFTYEGNSLELLTKYAINYNKDFMTKSESCSEDLTKLDLPLRWVVRKHQRTEFYKRNIILIFLKQYNCQFKKYGQGYELRGSPFFGYKMEEEFANILREYDGYGIEFISTFEAYSIIGKIKGLKCDKFIQKELNITYKLYELRGMKIEKYLECNK